MILRSLGAVTLFLSVLGSGCALPSQRTAPRWDHIVVVILENRSTSQVRTLPSLAALASAGREMTQSYGVARPSQPNYLALFSGSTQGVTDNDWHDLAAENLSTRLAARGYHLVSWAQSLPSWGFRGDAYPYLRKHNPAASFTNLRPDSLRPLSEFPTDFSRLPEISLVIPDMLHDMHDDSPAHSDAWLGSTFSAYASWAAAHRSLLIVTFDEPDTALGVDVASAPVFTVLVGQGIAPSTSAQRITHYTLLKYLLDSFGLPPLGLDAFEPVLEGL